MKLTIMIPMDDATAKNVGQLARGTVLQAVWPELSSARPMLPSEIATKAQEIIERWLSCDEVEGLIVTRSEMVVLRAQRIVAEGAALDVTIHFPGSAHPPVTVARDGEVSAWPVGLFSEDFEEVRAIRQAQHDRGNTNVPSATK